MKKITTFVLLLLAGIPCSNAQTIFDVSGLCIAAPTPEGVPDFIKFIDKELAPSGINTLVLRVDFNYAYESRPELRSDNPLTKLQVKQLVAACKKHAINLIPQINLLGHQSWAGKINKLLEVYPEFDETPSVKLPAKYEWPNDDGLYCKSYCPLHPDVHKVVFDLVDEIMEVFEAKAFHAGMDEVFYIANEKCPRCMGKDPATLFANEVNTIAGHLAEKKEKLWIWGDRLIDATTSGIGMWEASMNNTARAIDLIDKSVVICDWHYEKALPTPALFALKGLDVIACSWRRPDVAKEQVKMMNGFRKNATPAMKTHFLGTMHTVWSPASVFIENYDREKSKQDGQNTQEACFMAMVNTIKTLEKQNKKAAGN